MDGLRELARLTFQAQNFSPPNNVLDCHYISAAIDPRDTTTCNEITLAEDEVVPFWEDKAVNDEGPSATNQSFRLISIPRDGVGGLKISRHVFNLLVYLMRLDPYVLYLISRHYDGFHSQIGTDGILTAFIGTAGFSFIWTYDPQTMSTRVLVLLRLSSPFPRLRAILHAYRDHIHAPVLPAFLMMIHTIMAIDNGISDELDRMRKIEAETGYGFGRMVPMCARFDIDDISAWLRDVMEIRSNITNNQRHLGIVKEMASFVMQDTTVSKMLVVPDGQKTEQSESIARLRESVPIIQGMANSTDAYLRYLQERAGKLSSVLFALMTHEDAVSNIELARITRKISEAAKRDSSSMKTVAVMTMLFLPATFFAALFAIPSLRWDQEDVIQGNFWIYWAFTIPATIAIFVLWGFITNRKWILDGGLNRAWNGFNLSQKDAP